MTTPTDDHDDMSGPSEGPIDDDRLAALRAMLRDEPVDTDPAATETRILAALDAATDLPAGQGSEAPAVTRRRGGPRTTTVAPRHRRWSARPALVAAALLAVVGIGAVIWGSADRDAEFMASAGDAATAETTTSGPGDAAGGAADGGSPGNSAQDDTDGAAAMESAAPSSTLSPAPPAGAAGALDDLGRFDSADQLLRSPTDDLVERIPDEQGSDAGRSTQFDLAESAAATCAAQRSSSGERVLGIATVAGTAVLVVEVDGSRALLELPSCRRLP